MNKVEVTQKSLFGAPEEVLGVKQKKETAPLKTRSFPNINWASALDKDKIQGDGVFWLRILQGQKGRSFTSRNSTDYIKILGSEIAIKQGKWPISLSVKNALLLSLQNQ
jgi:hypothetical protein